MLDTGSAALNMREIYVRPVRSSEERRYQDLMQEHHYLGSLPKISETLRYVAVWCDEWISLLSFSASALKFAVRDQWIGWEFRLQYGRLKLVVNNSRFLILPDWQSGGREFDPRQLHQTNPFSGSGDSSLFLNCINNGTDRWELSLKSYYVLEL